MKDIKVNTNPDVEQVFQNYPGKVHEKILNLRELILEAAKEIEEINEIKETLKWGEPSYITKIGSTNRIDWKEKTPDQYAIYFKCTSKLVPTFRMLFDDKLRFEGNRAIVFELNENIPETEIKKCIKAGLTYHKVKHLEMLGL